MPVAPLSTLQPNLILRGDLAEMVGLTTAQGGTVPQGGSFTFAPEPGGNDITIIVTAEGVGAVPTTVTGVLLTSDNNGVSWQVLQASLPLVATGTPAPQTVQHLTPGRSYGISLSALTLGLATAVNIFVSAA